MKSLRVITLGCSKNTVDTEHLLSQLEKDFEIRDDESKPLDYLLINTCGFIGDAKEESVKTILEAAEIKKAGRVGKLIVFGCLSQRYMSELPEMIPEVDAWYGAREIAPIIKGLGLEFNKDLEAGRRLSVKGMPYAYLKISEGCDRRCSYCAIPFIRGAHKSVPMEILEKEARALADKGIKELILIAQDTTYYGLDLYRKRALAELLERLSKIDGIKWLRVHYSYPADFPEDVLELMSRNPKVCRYIDIPLQHVSNKVLFMMRRSIDGERTKALVKKMRSLVPGIAIRTTMIVGHPGEGESEFGELMEFVEETGFERLGAFKYSEEEGTYGADNFEDDIPEDVKESRYDTLMSVQREISFEFNRSRIGEDFEVLIDGYSEGYFICRSEFESPEVDGEILVPFRPESMGTDEPLSMVGSFIKVKIKEADEYDLRGEYVCESL